MYFIVERWSGKPICKKSAIDPRKTHDYKAHAKDFDPIIELSDFGGTQSLVVLQMLYEAGKLTKDCIFVKG